MKILIITHNFPPIEGGISTHTYEMAKNFTEQGHRVLVAAPLIRGTVRLDQKQSFRIFHFPLIKQGAWLRFLVTFGYSLIAFLKFRPAVIYTTHWANAGLVATLISYLGRLPHVLAVNGTEINFSPSQKKLYALFALVARRAAKIIALGSFQVFLLKKLNIPDGKIQMVPEGVNPDRFVQRDEDLIGVLRQKYQINQQKVLLTVGRLVPRKGHQKVIFALKKLLLEYHNVCYLIVGRGPEETRLKKITADLKLDQQVVFTGFVSEKEVISLYQLADIFVMPNNIVAGDLEGFGIVFAEANACAKPVIGGNSGGVGDIIQDGVNGYLVNPDSVVEIKQRLLTLLTNENLAKQMGLCGLAMVKNQFNYNRIARLVLEELTKTVRNHGHI